MTDRRKELKREFRERVTPAGIFCIRHIPSGRVFIGSSPNLPSILQRHLFQLQMRGHMSKELQADWNRDGQAAFAFEVLDELDQTESVQANLNDELATLLKLWMERLQPWGERGYHHPPRA